MILQKLPPFQNVAANVPAILPVLPLGMTYYGIILKRGGTSFTNAHLSRIQIFLGGKTIWDVTGPHNLVHNNYRNLHQFDYLLSHTHTENTAASYTQNATTSTPTAYSSQYDIIAFSDFTARTIGGESLGAIDTSIGYTSMGMQVDIGAATAPTLEAWAIVGPPKAVKDPNRATFRAMLTRQEAPSAAGEFSLQAPIGSRAGALLHSIFFHNTYATKLQVKKDGNYLLEEGESALLNFAQSLTLRNPQSGLTVYDPSTNGNQSSTISTLRTTGAAADFQFKLTLSAGDTITMYSSLYTVLDAI